MLGSNSSSVALPPSETAVDDPLVPAPMGALRSRRQAFDAWVERPRTARRVVVWLSLYLALVANWPLWIELARIGGAPSVYLPSIASMLLLTVCGSVALLSFTAWSRGMKPVWFGVVVLAAVVQYYMLS